VLVSTIMVPALLTSATQKTCPHTPLPAAALLHRLSRTSEWVALAPFLPTGLQPPCELAHFEEAQDGKVQASDECDDRQDEERIHDKCETRSRAWSGSTVASTTCSDDTDASPLQSLLDDAVDGNLLLGQVWELSQDAAGCRQVQQALEEADQKLQMVLVSELRGHVLQAIECPHANYVLQKCIIMMPHTGFQFILNELLAGGSDAVRAAVRHKYGCRIVKSLLEHGTQEQISPIVEIVMEDAIETAKHPYGTFVVQHMVLHLAGEARRRLLQHLTAGANMLASDPQGCATLGAALVDSGLTEEASSLARRLVEGPNLLVEMACLRHGHRAVKEVLELLEGRELDSAHRQLAAGAGQLRSSRYGRVVARDLANKASRRIDLDVVLGKKQACLV